MSHPPHDPSQSSGHQQPYFYYHPYPVPQEHPQSTLALILGLLGIVLCGVIAPFAWVIGKRAVREIDQSGGALTGRSSAQAGHVLGLIGTILVIVNLVGVVLFFVFLVSRQS